MKRILIIITTGFETTGGLTTVAMNYLRFMSKDEFVIDIASNNEAEDVLVKEVENWGGHYYNLGRRGNIFAYRSHLRKIIVDHHYDVIHVHGNSSTMALELSVAKREGIPCRFAHVHCSKAGHPHMDRIASPVFKKSYTKGIAVSEQAGNNLFGENGFCVMNNAIDLKKYSYNAEVRERLRCELHLEDRIVIGTVGKLNAMKNQMYLLEIFAELCKKQEERYHLLIVGGGSMEQELKQQAETLKIADKTTFLGMRTNVNEWIQAFDYFVFPSIFEGLGMVLIEAQASGVPCLASDSLPKESHVSDLVTYRSLSQSPADWAEFIALHIKDDDRQQRSDDACKSIREHGYDIRVEAPKLEALYRNS